MKSIFRLILPIFLILTTISIVNAESFFKNVSISPYLTIEKYLISSKSELSFVSDIPTSDPAPYPYPTVEIRYFKPTDMVSAGFSIQKSSVFVGMALSMPWRGGEFALTPCFDIYTGFQLSEFKIYTGYFQDLNRDCEDEITSPYYIGLGYSHIYDNNFELAFNIQYLSGSFDVNSEDYSYNSYSFTTRAGYNSGIIRPYIYISIEQWDFFRDNEHAVKAGVGITFGKAHSAGIVGTRYISNAPFHDDVVRKPNIYLYPAKRCSVDVTIKPNGEVVKSIPEYNNGWHIMAYPNGSIKDTEGFLFYEARVSVSNPDRGWSMGADEIRPFFNEVLIKYGFNDTEIKDFIDYWTVNLPKSPYYTIYPLLNEQLEKVCPLEISPAPDNILRLWFIFSPSDKKIEIQPPTIPIFDRTGFVATEWGGIIR